MRYIVPEGDSGKTVKELVLGSIGISVSFLRHLKFLENGIMLNGEKVTVRATVQEGDVLDLATENEREGSRLTPTDIPLDIVYEDSDLVVPSKSANMPTHPSHNHHGDTLADALAYRYRNDTEPFVFRPINRLDRNTSGLTLIAKNRISAANLSEQMRKGDIKKQYVAILDGIIPDERGSIETYMRRTAQSIIVREVCDKQDDADYALTHYLTIARSDKHSLVLACPATGRTHQLRVHFAHLGCPILGDDMYGTPSDMIDRHALHAIALSFILPSDGQRTTLVSHLPTDMQNAVEKLFGASLADSLYEHHDFL